MDLTCLSHFQISAKYLFKVSIFIRIANFINLIYTRKPNFLGVFCCCFFEGGGGILNKNCINSFQIYSAQLDHSKKKLNKAVQVQLIKTVLFFKGKAV